jgi:hypothetical protein
MSQQPRPLFVVTLQGRGTDSVRGLKQMLKRLGRTYHLRCVAVREVQQQPSRTHANESPPAARDTLGGTPKERKS